MIEVDDFVKFSKAFYRIEYTFLSDPVLQKRCPTLLFHFVVEILQTTGWVTIEGGVKSTQVNSSQTCTPILAGPFRAQAQNVSNCSTYMLHKGESRHSMYCKIE